MAGDLYLETDIPMINCENLSVTWKPQEHAYIELDGYVDPDFAYKSTSLYGSKIKLWLKEENREQVLFFGLLSKITETVQAGMIKVFISGVSASSLLESQKHSRSFQNISSTFYDIISLVTAQAGGQVICASDNSKEIGRPMIQYNETDWDFFKRISSHLNVPIIPDIETGNPCFWVGMCNGSVISDFMDTSYNVFVDNAAVIYQVKDSRNFKLGDHTMFLGHDVVIIEKKIDYHNGHLDFYYLLADEHTLKVNIQYLNELAGTSISGVVRNGKGESVSISFDIDQGCDTGEYFYDWRPNSGNAIYAVPETGSSVSLYFPNHDERTGLAVHCVHKTETKAYGKADFECRQFNILNSNSIELNKNRVEFARGGNHSVVISDQEMETNTGQNLDISASGKIKFRAKTISISSPDELVIYKG